jgi:hypothetical protein
VSISSTTRKSGPFIGNGSASVFPFIFKVFSSSDLEVVKQTTATGVETIPVLGTDYSVSLNLNQDSNPGGSVTLTAGALAVGYTLTIASAVPELQQTELQSEGGFYPEVITNALDKLTILVQQLQEQVDRSLKFPVSDYSDSSLYSTIPAIAERAGKYLAFDSNGVPEAGSAVGDGSVSVGYGEVIATDGQTVFTVPAYKIGSNSLFVFCGGLCYTLGVDYTETDTTHITLTAGAAVGEVFIFRVLH